jgi:hypothetical protein
MSDPCPCGHEEARHIEVIRYGPELSDIRVRRLGGDVEVGPLMTRTIEEAKAAGMWGVGCTQCDIWCTPEPPDYGPTVPQVIDELRRAAAGSYKMRREGSRSVWKADPELVARLVEAERQWAAGTLP